MTDIFKQKDKILEHIENHKNNIGFNKNIFRILEGGLIDLVEASLKEQLSARSFKTAFERVSPINVFRKTNNKRSTLYTDEVERSTEEESDQELIWYYENECSIDSFFEDANKGYNAYKYTALEFYLDEGKVNTRSIPSHMFLPYSDDPINPMKMTAMIKFMGTYEKYGKTNQLYVSEKYWVYSDDQFMAIDSDGDIVMEDMMENEGVNPFGVIPFVYINQSRGLLIPYPDKDDLAISLLVPVLLTDLNFAAKFLAHSVFYGIDIDVNEMQLSPDAVWIFKSDEKEGTKPEIGTIKPEVSIEDVLTLIKEQLTAWLDTKNVKTKGMGQADVANASGISKIIDEADTTLDRKQQMRMFRAAELDYWRKLAQIHNISAAAKEIENTATFSDPENLKVEVNYSEQKVLESRMEIVTRLEKEVNAGFLPVKRAVAQLHPRKSPEEIDELMEEIEEEKLSNVQSFLMPPREEDGDNEQES